MTATPETGRTGSAQSSSGPRIGRLDALRGFALGGILLVNIGQIMHMADIVDGRKLPIPHVLDLTAHQRFFPLFSLLFGVGFGIFLQALGSRWWLARFRYGPLEWAWRCVTWWQRVDLRRPAVSESRV